MPTLSTTQRRRRGGRRGNRKRDEASANKKVVSEEKKVVSEDKSVVSEDKNKIENTPSIWLLDYTYMMRPGFLQTVAFTEEEARSKILSAWKEVVATREANREKEDAEDNNILTRDQWYRIMRQRRNGTAIFDHTFPYVMTLQDLADLEALNERDLRVRNLRSLPQEALGYEDRPQYSVSNVDDGLYLMSEVIELGALTRIHQKVLLTLALDG